MKGSGSRTRKYFLAANWKSNGNTQFVKEIITHMINSFEYDPKKIGKSDFFSYLLFLDLMILPSALHISLVQAMVTPNVQVGAQNVSAHPAGAFTGEVAAEHLRDYGINWTLIGHSQRRLLFGETQETCTEKVKLARAQGMGVILCLGENLE